MIMVSDAFCINGLLQDPLMAWERMGARWLGLHPSTLLGEGDRMAPGSSGNTGKSCFTIVGISG